MNCMTNRRQFLARAGCGLASAGLAKTWAQDRNEPKVADHTLTVIAGKPRERGRQYGKQFKKRIDAFLEKELYQAFTKKPSPREDMLRYAGDCAKEIKSFSPIIMDELEGMAEGTGLKVEELVLINLHEELQKRQVLPKVEHCTLCTVGANATTDGNTYVGQTWDWMWSAYGMSAMLHWKRPEGPSVLAYSYPGQWVGAGLNSAGVALCWHSSGGRSVGVGIPDYLLIVQMLYQESLEPAVAEAKRAKRAGCFVFHLADAKGNLALLNGAPEKLDVQSPVKAGMMAGGSLGGRMSTMLSEGKGKLDRAQLQECLGKATQQRYTLDRMLFNTTKREAYVSRADAEGWQTFRFEGN